jgi:hypothetical protein
LTSGKIPKLFKRVKVIAILKHGKYGSDPSYFRPISLLSIVFKILERMILQRIEPLIDAVVSVSQVGFRKNRSCTEPILALTSHIEAGFYIGRGIYRSHSCFFQVFFGDIKWTTSKMCFGTVVVQPVLVRYPINIIEPVPLC